MILNRKFWLWEEDRCWSLRVLKGKKKKKRVPLATIQYRNFSKGMQIALPLFTMNPPPLVLQKNSHWKLFYCAVHVFVGPKYVNCLSLQNYLVHKRKHVQQKLHPLLPPQPRGLERISMKQSQLHPQLKLLLQLQTPLVHQEACHME